MTKNTILLAKYLYSKGIDSSLRIQKILFFLRVEEKRNNFESGYFKLKDNFQAWIYGPVNVESFKYMQKYFNNDIEKEEILLLDDDLEKNKILIEEIDKIFGKYLEKYRYKAPSTLVDESHRNLSWINARGDLDKDEPCNTYMKEDKSFIEFI